MKKMPFGRKKVHGVVWGGVGYRKGKPITPLGQQHDLIDAIVQRAQSTLYQFDWVALEQM